MVPLFLLLGTAYIHLSKVAAWYPPSTFHHTIRNRIDLRATSINKETTYEYNGEVVGSTGKIGSYILHSLNCKKDPNPAFPYDQYQYSRAFATPRGLAPGCLSKQDSPIYACIPSSSIRDVWDATVPNRRKDLVFLCNCIPSRHLDLLTDENTVEVTIAILHFGASKDQSGPKASCSLESPPTVIYGKHANTLSKLLEKDNIPVAVANSAQELQTAAVKKLAWSSLMWLLCHDISPNEKPLTVKDVHTAHSDKLQMLVKEIIPPLEALGQESWTEHESGSSKYALTTEDMMNYLETYSKSISEGNVTPNRDLALEEIHERNGLILSLMDKTERNDSYHLEVIRRVVGDELATQLKISNVLPRNDNNAVDTTRMQCSASNLSFLTKKQPTDNRPDGASNKSVIVIGAGMIGSSIAYHLSLRNINVTVMDINNNILPDNSSDDINIGTATSSSFAWLNANDKAPLSYMQLNSLGMETWRRHELLKKYPIWSGSLIRRARNKETDATMSPYYACIGPLCSEEVASLEPGINWATHKASTDEDIFYFPHEGHVDPTEAVKALRLSAQSNGVSFMQGVKINEVVSNDQGRVIGVRYSDSSNTNQKFLQADIVIVAAGANTSTSLLRGANLPLKDEPGVLAYTKSKNEVGDKNVLQRIFVDTVSQSHVLRRPDGTLVIGGGQLIVGGESTLDNGCITESTNRNDYNIIGAAMLETVTKSVKPLELPEVSNDTPVRITRANHPMPSDGLPAVGFIDSSGIYAAVTHSGITLGPLLGELAAYEVHSSLASYPNNHEPLSLLNILDDYRPSRFKDLIQAR